MDIFCIIKIMINMGVGVVVVDKKFFDGVFVDM